jgi:hypothetical protein
MFAGIALDMDLVELCEYVVESISRYYVPYFGWDRPHRRTKIVQAPHCRGPKACSIDAHPVRQVLRVR